MWTETAATSPCACRRSMFYVYRRYAAKATFAERIWANRRIVYWADTVTHAEWYVEVVDTYCKTVMIASQLRPQLNEIPPDKIADLLAIKKRWGLPDPRLASGAEAVETTAIRAADVASNTAPIRPPASYEVEELVSRLTAEVSGFLRGTE